MSPSREDSPAPGAVSADVSRRRFLKSAAGTALVASGLPHSALAAPAVRKNRFEPSSAESIVGRLYQSFNDQQKKDVCFDWDYRDAKRGLLRTFVSNNWNITPAEIQSDFYTPEQQALIREIFEGIIQPAWHARIDKQLQDDAGGFGRRQSLAIFGDPNADKFEFVMTGRHMTLRCDGNSVPQMAFGGPIFYGHAAAGFHEASNHPGNVFWPQAVAANKVFAMLDGGQRKQALVRPSPPEQAVGFGGPGASRAGISVRALSQDQQVEMQKVLAKLIEPYRQADQNKVLSCLEAQGGLDQCNLTFYSDRDIGEDGIWDNWRLEGPAFVWYFRGSPHVHVWVHIADNPDVPLNA